jgi:hypothetical protein
VEQVVKRSFSFALLALHLLVFVIGGALATEASAMASGPGPVVVATTSGGDGAAMAASGDGRLESGTRARAHRGERGASGGPLDAVVPRGLAAIAPAGRAELRDWRSAARGHCSLPCVVNGARGPPPARSHQSR